jgi:hypothetical protein
MVSRLKAALTRLVATLIGGCVTEPALAQTS